MNGTLTLKNPVMINGDKITEMKYDTNEIDGVLFATAEAKRKAAAGMKNLSVSAAAEFDFGLHLYLGYAAIVAVNPTYDFSDLERMKGADAPVHRAASRRDEPPGAPVRLIDAPAEVGLQAALRMQPLRWVAQCWQVGARWPLALARQAASGAASAR